MEYAYNNIEKFKHEIAELVALFKEDQAQAKSTLRDKNFLNAITHFSIALFCTKKCQT